MIYYLQNRFGVWVYNVHYRGHFVGCCADEQSAIRLLDSCRANDPDKPRMSKEQ